MSKIFFMKPWLPSIRVEEMLSTVMPRLYEMDFTATSVGLAVAVIDVPCNLGRFELRMSTGILSSIAGRRVLGCNTFAPKYASSDASWNDISRTRNAFFTMFGSAVRMPSTSVQISINYAFSTAPTIEAV